MRKYLLAALAAACAALSGPASAQPAPDIHATLKVFQWINPQIIDSTKKAIARFKEKYPNVVVETQFAPEPTWGEYNNAFLNQAASGDVPDIFASAIEGFSEIASKGLLLDLKDVIAKDPDAKTVLDGIDSNLLQGMRTRPSGELNYFPTEWNNIVIYYNKDKFDAAHVPYPKDDWTWDDFLDAAKKLTLRDASGAVAQYGFVVPGFNFGLTPWLYVNDASIFDDDWRKPTVTTANFKESLQFLHGLIHDSKVAPAFQAGDGGDKFVAGQVAMLASGHWPLPEIIKSGMTRVGVQIVPIRKSKTTVYGIGGLGITKAAKNPELAWAFIKELTGRDYQQELADSNRSIPTARAFTTSAKWTAFPDNAQLFYETARYAKPVQAPPNYAKVEEIFMRHVGAYMNDSEDLDAAIAGLDSELTRAMARAYR
jgi:multiple sugar transport system substrate-binding protein